MIFLVVAYKNDFVSVEKFSFFMLLSLSSHDNSTQALLLIFHAQDVIVDGSDETNKVVEFVQPQVLEDRLDVKLESKASDSESLIATCKDIVRYSVKTGHPMFFNQLYQGEGTMR